MQGRLSFAIFTGTKISKMEQWEATQNEGQESFAIFVGFLLN